MLLYKVLILFWGYTRTCYNAWWFENRITFHIIYIITIKNKMCCDWLAVPVRCDWRTA